MGLVSEMLKFAQVSQPKLLTALAAQRTATDAAKLRDSSAFFGLRALGSKFAVVHLLLELSFMCSVDVSFHSNRPLTLRHHFGLVLKYSTALHWKMVIPCS
jgi:hypothetical protein